MINKVSIKDKELFNKIGFQVNSNFSNLFDLEYIINSNNEDVFGYYVNDILVGFIHVLHSFECLEIINVVVDTEYRNKGIATKLIDYVMNYYEGLEYLLLEVNENNVSAINLYKKLNFEVINIRKKYYGNDDALIMKRGLI
jgi:ribosomal protein S18 acetylase RimI-like enzyme